MVDEVLSEMARHRPIAEVMSQRPFCVNGDASLEAATEMLLERGLSAAPVIDDDGRLLGVLSMTDIVREHAEHDESDGLIARESWNRIDRELVEQALHGMEPSRTVEEVMSKDVAVLEESASLSFAAAFFARNGVHRTPIVDGEGKVVGLLSALDLLGWWARQDGYDVAAPKRVPSV